MGSRILIFVFSSSDCSYSVVILGSCQAFPGKANRKETPGFLTANKSAVPKGKFMAKIKDTSVASGFLYDEFQRLAASEINFISVY